jgi:hypothetical protein
MVQFRYGHKVDHRKENADCHYSLARVFGGTASIGYDDAVMFQFLELEVSDLPVLS